MVEDILHDIALGNLLEGKSVLASEQFVESLPLSIDPARFIAFLYLILELCCLKVVIRDGLPQNTQSCGPVDHLLAKLLFFHQEFIFGLWKIGIRLE